MSCSSCIRSPSPLFVKFCLLLRIRSWRNSFQKAHSLPTSSIVPTNCLLRIPEEAEPTATAREFLSCAKISPISLPVAMATSVMLPVFSYRTVPLSLFRMLFSFCLLLRRMDPATIRNSPTLRRSSAARRTTATRVPSHLLPHDET